MTNRITLKKSSVPSKAPQPEDLVYGELAINYADKKLYFKNSNNTVSHLANQDTFSIVSVGSTTISASSTTDTLSISSSGAISITPDSQAKSIALSLDETQITSFVRKDGDTLTGNIETSADITLKDSGQIVFPDGSVQTQRSPRVYTNADFDADGNPLYPFVAGDYYYDNFSDSLYVYVNFGDYSDFKDITVRA